MKINILAIIISIVLSGAFLIYVLIPPSAFNYIPFFIHQSVLKSLIDEALFIKIFDVLVSILLMFIIYKVAKILFSLRSFSRRSL